MGEYLSPVVEGFSINTFDASGNKLFNLLKDASSNIIEENCEYLHELIKDQKHLATSLIESAKRIGGISDYKEKNNDADDAAFEIETPAPLPNTSGTLQGFTLVFFTLSFISLAIVFSIKINQVSNNTSYAVYTFIFFLVLFVVAFALIIRFG
jgi:hypothetical protein